jgi:hypothetical protein
LEYAKKKPPHKTQAQQTILKSTDDEEAVQAPVLVPNEQSSAAAPSVTAPKPKPKAAAIKTPGVRAETNWNAIGAVSTALLTLLTTVTFIFIVLKETSLPSMGQRELAQCHCQSIRGSSR